jgi:hypothetical protein
MRSLKFIIPPRDLIPRGYEFQKLFASNYRCYHKEVADGYKFWLWVRDKEIEINDWYSSTFHILDFFKANRTTQDQVHKDECLKVQLNPNTGHVQLFDYEEEYRTFDRYKEDKNGDYAWKLWNEKYYGWHNNIYLFKEHMERVIEEVDFLTGEKMQYEL